MRRWMRVAGAIFLLPGVGFIPPINEPRVASPSRSPKGRSARCYSRRSSITPSLSGSTYSSSEVSCGGRPGDPPSMSGSSGWSCGLKPSGSWRRLGAHERPPGTDEPGLWELHRLSHRCCRHRCPSGTTRRSIHATRGGRSLTTGALEPSYSLGCAENTRDRVYQRSNGHPDYV